MKLNENLKIMGTNVVLVPYEAKHVAKYHNWMKSEELQKLTASEPLTLDEEYRMQKSWREDEDKCTFLILDRARHEQTKDELEALVGDTNIFLQSTADGEEFQISAVKEEFSRAVATETARSKGSVGEIEIMIAEAGARGQRLGWEATLLMLRFGIEYLHIRRFLAITKDTNSKAMRMFERMKFRESKRTSVFQEVTFDRLVDETWIGWLSSEVPAYTIVPYQNQ